MISLFLLIFACQNGLATGEVTLNDLQLTMIGMNDKINKLEVQVQDLQSEVKERVILHISDSSSYSNIVDVRHQQRCSHMIWVISYDSYMDLNLPSSLPWMILVKTLNSKNQELESIVEMKELEERFSIQLLK